MQNGTRVCAGCGEPITINPRERNKKKWCSDSCRVRTYRRKHPDKVKAYSDRKCRERADEGAQRPSAPPCKNCGKPLAVRRNGFKYCSQAECQRARKRARESTAPRCSVVGCDRPVIANGVCGSHYAIMWAKDNRDRSRTGKHRYRARKRAAFVEDVSLPYVLARDGQRCGICGEIIPRGVEYPDRRSASLDHIIPLALGGTHELSNVQAAHFGCNSRKAARGTGDQLLLFG